jgi:hypothetical protein
MYNRFRSNRGGRARSFSPRGGNRFGGARRIKSFDPSQIVNLPPRIEQSQEYVVTHQFADFAISDSIKRNIRKKAMSPLPQFRIRQYLPFWKDVT